MACLDWTWARGIRAGCIAGPVLGSRHCCDCSMCIWECATVSGALHSGMCAARSRWPASILCACQQTSPSVADKHKGCAGLDSCGYVHMRVSCKAHGCHLCQVSHTLGQCVGTWPAHPGPCHRVNVLGPALPVFTREPFGSQHVCGCKPAPHNVPATACRLPVSGLTAC